MLHKTTIMNDNFFNVRIIGSFILFFFFNNLINAQTKIFWASQDVNKIMCINSDKTGKFDVISTDLANPVGLAIDTLNDKIYWSDFGTDNIERANLNGSSRETVISGLTSVLGIALDLENNKIYWAGGNDQVILRADIDGSNIDTLVKGLDHPIGIALDVANNKIYWTDNSVIQTSDLNGQNVSELDVAAIQPQGIAIDHLNEKIYWIESYLLAAQIKRSNLDGTDEETVLLGDFNGSTGYDLKHPAWIALDVINEIIYWTDAYAVISVDFNGDNQETIYHDGLDWPGGGVAIYHGTFTVFRADFFADPLSGDAPLEVQFTDQSNGEITNHFWDFGDGNTSAEQNPSHIYETPGDYIVTLIVSNDTDSDTLIKQNYITVSPSITADFSAVPTEGPAPLAVQFTDNTTGNVSSWSWDFGDGGTSTEQNPSHIYETAGEYTVSLMVRNEFYSDTLTREDYITVSVPSTNANFSFEIIKETVPVTVHFTDSSSGILTSWLWDFGDGSTSTEQNPSHSYQNPKEFYNVTLTVSSDQDKDSIQKEVYGGVLWERSTGDLKVGGVFHNYPAIGVDETIYYTTTNGPNRLLAINPEGTLKWKYEVFDRSIRSAPSIDKNGTIYVCSSDSCLYAINPDGSIKWKFKFNHIYRYSKSPAIGNDGTIYIGGYSSLNDEIDEYLYAINPDGTLRWEYEFDEGLSGVLGTPVVGSDGTIYIESFFGFYAINPDGTFKWNSYIESSRSNPAIGKDGMVYVSGYDALIAYNPDGTVKWSNWGFDSLNFSGIGPPVIGIDGSIYFARNMYTTDYDLIAGYLYALNPDGTTKWKTMIDASLNYSPTVGLDGTIYVAGSNSDSEPQNHGLYAFNANGTQKWNFIIDDPHWNVLSTAPIINSDGTLYFSIDNSIYAIATDNGGLARSSWPCFQGNALNTGTINPTTDVINLELINNNSITCYPNPFNHNTTVQFEVEKSEHISLDIFSIRGSKVKTLISEILPSGKHEVAWNGTNQSGNKLDSGLYLIKLTSKNKTQTNKILLE